MHEVVAVGQDGEVTLRDRRSGDETSVTMSEGSWAPAALSGSLWCARIVPDGTGHQSVGTLFLVTRREEQEVLELCARRDPIELCMHVASTGQRPIMVTRESEAMVECEAVLRVGDNAEASRVLDGLYQRRDHDWVENFELDDGESVIRATLWFDGDQLKVLTHSVERMDRVLAVLGDALPGCDVVSDERIPIAPGSMPRHMPGTSPGTVATTSSLLTPEQREDFLSAMEQRWLLAPLGALGGRSPVDAASETAGREQVARLIDSFPDLGEPILALRPARLRTALGL